MKLKTGIICTAAFLASMFLLLGFAPINAAEPTPGFNNKIPEGIMTPDLVLRSAHVQSHQGVVRMQVAAG